MSYREGYDINRWVANEARRRRRSAWLRWLLALGFVVVLAMPAVAIVAAAGDREPASVLPYLPLMFGLTRSPFARDSWASSRALHGFDEFERDALGRATRLAYAAFTLVIVAAAAWLWAAARWNLPAPATAHQWSTCFFTLLSIGIALPVVLAEWIVPLPPALDEMED